ncbi:hypothetical protein GCM10023350_05740 [Nocardioides endophyticus]|uniref:N-terminal of MaoC-like dehydratase domain-containing protein n=1 Tax=Nocardioides endophyticus TaxID=1353775 RepID=A0ABP8YDX1_9ACTN
MGAAMVDGALRIQGYEDWLLRDAVGAVRDADRPHGAWAIVGPFRGMGTGLEGLFELLGAGTEDGLMFGECRVEQFRPLERDRDYVVTCKIVGSTRHRGRKVAEFDAVDYVTEVVDDEGIAVRCRNVLIVPREQQIPEARS